MTRMYTYAYNVAPPATQGQHEHGASDARADSNPEAAVKHDEAGPELTEEVEGRHDLAQERGSRAQELRRDTAHPGQPQGDPQHASAALLPNKDMRRHCESC